MKIGILTYHSVYNFGANLQVYSTVGYLKNYGFEPIVINYIPEDLEARYIRTIPPEQANAHIKFIENNIPCSEICRSEIDIAEVIRKQKIKGIIIGSDAVLQHMPLLSRIHITKKGIIFDKKPGSDILFPNPFWGSFTSYLKEKIPIVIMSASSQNTNFKYIRGRVKKRMNLSLNQFQIITVRDKWTKKMVKYLTKGTIDSPITPDPVFAYNQNIKNQISKEELTKTFNLAENYILFSFTSNKVVSKEWMHFFQNLAEKNNLQCVALTMPGGILFDPPFPKIIKPPLSPKEWYGLIRFSSGYMGELMHATVVALHNSVPFYAFDPYGIIKYKYFVNEKSSKIYDILSIAGFLNNRISIIGRGYKCPPPEKVFNQIINFDSEKCNLFINNQLEKYNNMMKNLIDHLT